MMGGWVEVASCVSARNCANPALRLPGGWGRCWLPTTETPRTLHRSRAHTCPPTESYPISPA
eukprot:974295-Rhodomonas_salina.1